VYNTFRVWVNNLALIFYQGFARLGHSDD
jgi:hypothetical protein